jgi:serine/threonine protein kinase
MAARPTRVNCLEEMAEEFARRVRAGERPTIEEYARRQPKLAKQIRAVLGGVELLEKHKPSREEAALPVFPLFLAETAPERIGWYRIVREIGKGGMGTVYEAKHDGLGCSVAIKVLPHVLAGKEKFRAHFFQEARAAGRLCHKNIVSVYGYGEWAGRCFYVMQLVLGTSLDRFIRTARRSHIGGMRYHRTVARIGIQAADALGYAHSQGILHRDVKPSNLLIDAEGVVRITDFGVAGFTREDGQAVLPGFAGTFRYMPPERFAGKSDIRSDLYSLGVTLYEMLTFQPAFADAVPADLIRQIRERDRFVPPRKVRPEIPAGLEAVVLKAMAQKPRERYGMPQELAEELKRFLN